MKELSTYLQYVANLQYTEKPDYNHCRQIFIRALSSIGCKETAGLDFVHCLSSPKVSLLLLILVPENFYSKKCLNSSEQGKCDFLKLHAAVQYLLIDVMTVIR